MLSEAAKHLWRRGGKVTVKPHTTRRPKQQEDQMGIRGERGSGSVTLLGKRAIRRGERGWMLTINTHGVEFSIAGGVEEIISDPNPMPRGCSYIGVLPSTLTLRDSYSRVTRHMTHSESSCEIHQLTRPSQLRIILQPIKTHKTSHVP